MSDHTDKINADIERITKLMRGVMERCYEYAEENEYENFRLDTCGLVGVTTWTDENGDDVEEPISAFESRKPHIQMGVMSIVLEMLKNRTH